MYKFIIRKGPRSFGHHGLQVGKFVFLKLDWLTRVEPANEVHLTSIIQVAVKAKKLHFIEHILELFNCVFNVVSQVHSRN